MGKRSPGFRPLAAILAVLLLLSAFPPAVFGWSSAPPQLTVSAVASADGQTVTATVGITKSDAIAGLQFDLVYDKTVLTAQTPKLHAPWAGMLAAVNIPEPGRVAVAAATASSGISNSGGTVATVTFSVSDGGAGATTIALRNIELCGTDGSETTENLGANTTVSLRGSAGSGGGSGGGLSVTMTPAQRLEDVILLQENNYAALVDGALAYIDPNNKAVVPYINEDKRTMVPLRFIGESLGATVEWVGGKTEQIRITYADKGIRMTIGSPTYSINGVSYTMDTEPLVTDGRTRVPIRMIAEGFGRDVQWDPVHSLVVVSPANAPWNSTGTVENTAAAQALVLLSPLMRDLL